jgi:hypothetical protein
MNKLAVSPLKLYFRQEADRYYLHEKPLNFPHLQFNGTYIIFNFYYAYSQFTHICFCCSDL